MTERNRKLPQSTHHLRAARAGIQMLEELKPTDDGLLLFLVTGVLACLRAVQHTLHGYDRKLSAQHRAVIGEWWRDHPPESAKELSFIKKSRDRILKETFDGGAGFRWVEFDSSGTARRIPKRWEIHYLVDGKPKDLLADMRAAADWCERELAAIELRVPPIPLVGDSFAVD